MEKFDDLPEELKQQLAFYDTGRLIVKLREVLKDFPEGATYDEMLIGLYRKFGVIAKRHTLVQYINRMSKNKEIESVYPRVWRLKNYEKTII